MKKPGFSYIELIFSMVVVVILMAMTLPLATQRAKKATPMNPYGEYRCWVLYDENGKEVFYEQEAYNQDVLSTPKPAANNKCIFKKPAGANSFTVTLSGAGSAGTISQTLTDEKVTEKVTFVDANNPSSEYASPIYSVSFLDEQNKTIIPTIKNPFATGTLDPQRDLDLSYSNSKVIYTPKADTQFYVDGFDAFQQVDAVRVFPGLGGKAGEVITLQIPANAMPFTNDEITINTVANTSLTYNNTPIALGKPSKNSNSKGSISKINIARPELMRIDGRYCRTSGRYTSCFAMGGEKQDSNEYRPTLIPATPDQTYVIVKGEDGKYNPEVALYGGTGGDTSSCPTPPGNNNNFKKCLYAKNAQHPGVGGGGSGSAYYINETTYKFQKYNIIKMYQLNEDGTKQYLNSSYDIHYPNAQTKPSPTQLKQITALAETNKGYSGGGAIYIKW